MLITSRLTKKKLLTKCWLEQADYALKKMWNKVKITHHHNIDTMVEDLPMDLLSTKFQPEKLNLTEEFYLSKLINDKEKRNGICITDNDITFLSTMLSKDSLRPETLTFFDYKLLDIKKLSKTSLQGLKTDDKNLNLARRRIKLTKDFDEMLINGFPTMKLSNDHLPEFTIRVSLTPQVAII